MPLAERGRPDPLQHYLGAEEGPTAVLYVSTVLTSMSKNHGEDRSIQRLSPEPEVDLSVCLNTAVEHPAKRTCSVYTHGNIVMNMMFNFCTGPLTAGRA